MNNRKHEIAITVSTNVWSERKFLVNVSPRPRPFRMYQRHVARCKITQDPPCHLDFAEEGLVANEDLDEEPTELPVLGRSGLGLCKLLKDIRVDDSARVDASQPQTRGPELLFVIIEVRKQQEPLSSNRYQTITPHSHNELQLAFWRQEQNTVPERDVHPVRCQEVVAMAWEAQQQGVSKNSSATPMQYRATSPEIIGIRSCTKPWLIAMYFCSCPSARRVPSTRRWNSRVSCSARNLGSPSEAPPLTRPPRPCFSFFKIKNEID